MQVRRNRGIAELGLFKSFDLMRSSLGFGVTLITNSGLVLIYRYAANHGCCFGVFAE